jgi:hypothetical protein
MKLRSLTTTLSIGFAILLSGPVHAQAGDPCTAYTCMASVSGFGSPTPSCAAGYAAFFSQQVWSPHYNPPATAARRMGFLMGCPGADTPGNAAILTAIINMWGQVLWATF